MPRQEQSRYAQGFQTGFLLGMSSMALIAVLPRMCLDSSRNETPKAEVREAAEPPAEESTKTD